MLHMVMRQRRRFAFALLMTELALIGVVPQAWIFGVMLLGMMVGIALLSATGHAARRVVECGAIGLLVSSRLPDVTLIAVAFVGTTVLAYILLYSPLLDRLPVRIGLRSRKTFQVPMDSRTVWGKLIPGQGHKAAYWTGRLQKVRRDEHDDCTLYLTSETQNGKPDEFTVTYLKLDPHREATYLLERDSYIGDEEVIMTYKLVQTEPERTFIASDMQVSGLPIRHAVDRFFDDVLGDELDSFATMTECRRSWSLRDASDVALTSALGRDKVTLNVDLPKGEEDSQQHRSRLSA